MKTLIWGLIFLCSASAQAKLFKNSYLSIDLPERWNCSAEGTEWICKSDEEVAAKEAIIIFTAKEAGPSDTIDQYEAYLKTPKTSTTETGQPVQSQVKIVQKTSLADQTWVDGLHLSSEIPNYYTRYIATTKGRIAILVTFSAHVSVYTKYSADFLNAIKSLRVIATPDLFQPKSLVGGEGGELLGSGGSGIGLGAGQLGTNLPEPTKSSGKKEKLFGFGLVLLALGVFIFLRARRKK